MLTTERRGTTSFPTATEVTKDSTARLKFLLIRPPGGEKAQHLISASIHEFPHDPTTTTGQTVSVWRSAHTLESAAELEGNERRCSRSQAVASHHQCPPSAVQLSIHDHSHAVALGFPVGDGAARLPTAVGSALTASCPAFHLRSLFPRCLFRFKAPFSGRELRRFRGCLVVAAE